MPRLTSLNYERAVELAKLPMQLRGFGHVKDANRAQLSERRDRLLRTFAGTDAADAVRFIDPNVSEVA